MTLDLVQVKDFTRAQRAKPSGAYNICNRTGKLSKKKKKKFQMAPDGRHQEDFSDSVYIHLQNLSYPEIPLQLLN